MAKRKQDIKVTQTIKAETIELFQLISDEQAETIKGGRIVYSNFDSICNRTGRVMTPSLTEFRNR